MKGEETMLKFNEQKQIDSVNGALALRGQINDLVDGICKEGYKNICWLGIGGTYASCLQAEVHMKEKSELPFFVENAAEYLTTGNKKVGEGTIVIISSVTGSTSEIVEGVKKAQAAGAKVIGFIDVATAELAKLVDHVITYPANEQLKFYMVADRFMYNAGEFPEYDDLYSELDQHLAQGINLLYFLPSAAMALPAHWRNGSVVRPVLLPAILAGLLTAGVTAWVATVVEVELLRRCFGGFLIIIGGMELFGKERGSQEPSS